MSPRFATNLVLVVAGGFIVVESQTFATAAVGWVTFGVAVGILMVALLSQIDSHRGLTQRGLDAVAVILGAWTIIASLVFAGSTLTWLSFAEGIGFVSLAAIGLILHELSTERVVHSLTVESPSHATAHYQEAA